MLDKDTKDFERQFSIEIGKGTFLKDFQHSEALKECLFSEFAETQQKPDLLLYQMAQFESETEYWQFIDEYNKHEAGRTNYNEVSPYEEKFYRVVSRVEIAENKFLDTKQHIDIECIELHKNGKLNKRYYSHQLSQTETYKALKKINDSYYLSLTELQVNEYKDELKELIGDFERQLNKLKTDSAKIDVLNVFLEKKYGMMHAFTMYKSELPDNELKKQHSNFNKRLDNYLDAKIQDLSQQDNNKIKDGFKSIGYEVFERYIDEYFDNLSKSDTAICAFYYNMLDNNYLDKMFFSGVTKFARYIEEYTNEYYNKSIDLDKIKTRGDISTDKHKKQFTKMVTLIKQGVNDTK
ncbi:hypothetical protein [Plebeiibacterium sediminum]|uniref:Uncharacterized protein n=1 Tax=Plebeiibacterium sediminum TaxID=2992112 RepID=A0AAE3SF33_9BACT|nr:hypothetical protein [Plebeiobacterium sediminum]MCW3786841.1 hypothetical protein [Plebeiobacterium sediminum]